MRRQPGTVPDADDVRAGGGERDRRGVEGRVVDDELSAPRRLGGGQRGADDEIVGDAGAGARTCVRG